ERDLPRRKPRPSSGGPSPGTSRPQKSTMTVRSPSLRSCCSRLSPPPRRRWRRPSRRRVRSGSPPRGSRRTNTPADWLPGPLVPRRGFFVRNVAAGEVLAEFVDDEEVGGDLFRANRGPAEHVRGDGRGDELEEHHEGDLPRHLDALHR